MPRFVHSPRTYTSRAERLRIDLWLIEKVDPVDSVVIVNPKLLFRLRNEKE